MQVQNKPDAQKTKRGRRELGERLWRKKFYLVGGGKGVGMDKGSNPVGTNPTQNWRGEKIIEKN